MPMATKFDRMMAYLKWLPPIRLFDHLVLCFARSRDKLKLLYLQYRSACGHQTWKDGELLWGLLVL